VKSPAERKKAPAQARSNSYRKHVLAGVLLFATVFLAYANSLNGTWAMDDVHATKLIEVNDFRDVVGFRKVSYLTFLLNQQIAPFSPYYFRLFNIFLHFLNAALLYVLSYKSILMFYENRGRRTAQGYIPAPEAEKTAFGAALISSAIFALHPLNINAVAYIVQRMTSLATFFVLLSLLAYIAAGRSKNNFRGILFYALSVFFLIAGIFSKENAVMGVPLILLYDYVFLSGLDMSRFRKKAAIILVLCLATLGTASYFLGLHRRVSEIMHIFINYNTALPDMAWTAADVDWTPLQHVLTEFRVVTRYLFLVFAPLPAFLVFDWWGFPVSRGIMDPITTLLSMLFILSLLFLSIWKIRRFPLAGFGILWYLTAISLESFLAPGLDFYYEHRNYLALTGLFLGLTGQVLVSTGGLKKNKFILVIAAVLCLALGSLTFVRNFVWKDSVTLWTDTARKNPSNLRAMMSLGNAYMNLSDMEKAEECYKDIVKRGIDSKRLVYLNEAAYSLGMIYLHKGEMQKAAALIDKLDLLVESYKPKILRAYYKSKTGDFDGAIRGYLAVLPEIEGVIVDNVVVNSLLGDAYRAKGMWDAAIERYERSLALDPTFASAYYGIGVAYMSQRNVQLAYDYFHKTLVLEPDNSLALADMADLMLIKGTDPQDALTYARKAVSKSPASYQPYLAMGNILTVMGREKEADEFYGKALAHDMPDYMTSFNKARAYYLKGDREKAGYYLSDLRRYKNLPENIRIILTQ
jgi:tetratricopeptide (TPR) repeat protein